jgi:hypothetical protein
MIEIDELKKILPEPDVDYLVSKYTDLEVIKNVSDVHVIFHNYDFPEVYQPRQANLLIILPVGYPNAKGDMFWTYPDVQLAIGKWPISSEVHQDFHGKSWQRWSRHISWRSGIDNLRTFITAVQREITRGI